VGNWRLYPKVCISHLKMKILEVEKREQLFIHLQELPSSGSQLPYFIKS